MKPHLPRGGRRTLACVLSIVTLGACTTPVEPPITGYTCCNMRTEHGWISSNNVQGGTLVPAGEPVRLTSIKKQYYVYGTVGSSEMAFRDDAAKVEADTMAWLRRVIVAQDPREQLAQWPTEIRLAVRSAKVLVGMSREQVLMALGHPSRADTPDLKAAVWRYWTPLEDLPVDLHFADDGRLSRLAGKASAVRTLEHTP